MIEFLASLAEFEGDYAANTVWNWIRERFADENGICYYKHPVVVTATGTVPDLTLLTRGNQPLAITCFSYQLDEIQRATAEVWEVNRIISDSPNLAHEDFIVGLRAKFDEDRLLRNRLQPKPVLALPLISRTSVEERFGTILKNYCVI